MPFDFDPDPSPLIEAIPDAVHSPTRIARPMVRSGWLQKGQMSGAGRGREPFVPVEWPEALDLVAGELARVRREHGPAAIMGGSQGWSSAGHLHEARGQLRRFLAAADGFVDQTSNYSFGTALTFRARIGSGRFNCLRPSAVVRFCSRQRRPMPALRSSANNGNLEVLMF